LAEYSTEKKPHRGTVLQPVSYGHEIWSSGSSTRSTVKTGHRIKYAKVDADTGEEVSNEDIMKGYKVDTDTYIKVKDELDNIALESTRTIACAPHGNMHWHPLSDDWFH
jgi:hypothetical protein